MLAKIRLHRACRIVSVNAAIRTIRIIRTIQAIETVMDAVVLTSQPVNQQCSSIRANCKKDAEEFGINAFR